MPPQLDPRKVINGSQGEIYALDGNYVGDVPDCEVRLTIGTIQHRGMRSYRNLRLLDSTEVSVTFTQTVVSDEMLRRCKDAFDRGEQPVFDFQCDITRPDGSRHRSVFHQCVPDGDITILSYRPGELMVRPWTFYVNGAWDMPEGLTG